MPRLVKNTNGFFMRKTDLAWVAGIVDGEGCICIRKVKGRYYFLQLSVGMTDASTIARLKSFFGGNIHTKPGKKVQHKTCYIWNVGSDQAVSCLKKLKPYLFTKLEQACLAIDFMEAAMEARPELHTAMHLLNKRGT